MPLCSLYRAGASMERQVQVPRPYLTSGRGNILYLRTDSRKEYIKLNGLPSALDVTLPRIEKKQQKNKSINP